MGHISSYLIQNVISEFIVRFNNWDKIFVGIKSTAYVTSGKGHLSTLLVKDMIGLGLIISFQKVFKYTTILYRSVDVSQPYLPTHIRICSVGYDTFKVYHDTDTDTFSEKYHDADT